MITISLCMIVRNEEAVLDRCLTAVKGIADEIIIVDTGSTDATKQVAAQYTNKVYDFAWIDDFAAARNYSFSKATKDYVLWLDADDIIDEHNQKKFKKLKKTLPSGIDRVTMPYWLLYDEEDNVQSSLRRNRLVRRDCNFQWVGPVHELLDVSGPHVESKVVIKHGKEKSYTDRNLQIYLAREQKGEVFSPRDLYYFANELRDHKRHAEAITYYKQFLETEQGWVEDNIAACLKMSYSYKELDDQKQQFAAMCKTLLYDAPRAQYCCDMGQYFMDQQNYLVAIYWNSAATRCDNEQGNLAVVNPAYHTWYPNLQLCLCYDKLGQHEVANLYNEKAITYHPTHPSLLFNRKYFCKLLGNDWVKGEGAPAL